MMISLLLLELALLTVASCNTIQFGFVAIDNSVVDELRPSVEIALELINNNPAILPGYQLQYSSWLSQVDS